MAFLINWWLRSIAFVLADTLRFIVYYQRQYKLVGLWLAGCSSFVSQRLFLNLNASWRDDTPFRAAGCLGKWASSCKTNFQQSPKCVKEPLLVYYLCRDLQVVMCVRHRLHAGYESYQLLAADLGVCPPVVGKLLYVVRLHSVCLFSNFPTLYSQKILKSVTQLVTL